MSEQTILASTPLPVAVDVRSSKAGLRAIATLEAVKGALVVVLGIALLLVHSHVEDYTESLLYNLHIDFDRRFGHMLLNAATTVSDARWWSIGVAAGSYALVRFVEAWGLWNQRVWAEWFALLSGALYLPFEFLKVTERADLERVSILVINLVIVLYMLRIRVRECRSGRGGCTAATVTSDTLSSS